LPRGLQAAQIAHAAGETGSVTLPQGTHVVVLGVESEEALRKLSHRLASNSIPHKLIRENDPPYSGQATALGVMPQLKSEVKRHLREYRLLE